MRIAILAPAPVPAVVGGAERLWDGLLQGLIARGHEAQLITHQFRENNLLEVLAGYRWFHELDVSEFDLVITGKYPAWMINHPRHLVYLLHPLRGLYDTYPTRLAALDPAIAEEIQSTSDVDQLLTKAQGLLEDDPEGSLHDYPGPFAKAVIQRLDQIAFAGERVAAFAAISEEVAGRPGYIPAERSVLVSYPESNLPVHTTGLETLESPLFFTASRLDRPKRIDLIIRAFRSLKDLSATLRIAGSGPQFDELVQLAGTDHRIEFLGRISEEDLAQNYAQATAVVFVPDNEDFGYITLEAIRSGTPVITTTDSGGAQEMLSDGVGGMVVEPTVEAIAQAMVDLANSPRQQWVLGLNGRRRASEADWSELWRLIEDQAQPAARPKALVLSTFAVSPTVGGGQRRVRYLTRQLARHADVTVLALAGDQPDTSRRTIELGLEQVVVPRTQQHRDAETEITRLAELPIDDITCGVLWEATPGFTTELDRQLSTADIVICSHPFLSPSLLGRLGDTPLVYDCHNAEADFKDSVLARTPAGDWLRSRVRESEYFATANASKVIACTSNDVPALQRLVPSIAETDIFDIVANGVDLDALPYRNDDQHVAFRSELLALIDADDLTNAVGEGPPIAVFVGSWHPPNLEAAQLILEASQLLHDWIFILAGSHTISINTSEYANVYALPEFAEESLYPILAGADVALNPMASGGGSNLKLYDYLAVGVPVLTTAIGARGLAGADAKDVLWTCEPTAKGVADGLCQIAEDAGSTQTRTLAGRAFVEQNVSWTDLGDRWAASVLSVLDKNALTRTRARPRRLAPQPPVTSATAPPPANPAQDVMTRIANAAKQPAPPKEVSTMDPSLRENIRKMLANKHAGQRLPEDARFRSLKQLAVRASKIVTNEQVNFNDATLKAVEVLTDQVQELTLELQDLKAERGTQQ